MIDPRPEDALRIRHLARPTPARLKPLSSQGSARAARLRSNSFRPLLILLFVFALFFLRLVLFKAFYFLAGMCFQRGANVLVVALVHAQDDALRRALFVKIDVQPVALRF